MRAAALVLIGGAPRVPRVGQLSPASVPALGHAARIAGWARTPRARGVGALALPSRRAAAA